MCEKASTCGCTGKAPAGGVGTAPFMAGFWFIGTCIAVVLAYGILQKAWPYALAGAAAIGGWKAYQWRQRRAIAARTVPLPENWVLEGHNRTAVADGWVRSLDGQWRPLPGMAKTPAPMVRGGRGHS